MRWPAAGRRPADVRPEIPRDVPAELVIRARRVVTPDGTRPAAILDLIDAL